MSKPFRVAPFMKARRRKNPRVHQWVSGHAKCSIRVPVGCHPVITRSDAGTRATVCAQPCPTLCDPRDCDLPGSSAHGVLQARILGGLPFPSPGDLPSRGIDSGLLCCRQILYPLSHQECPPVTQCDSISPPSINIAIVFHLL